MKLLSLACIFFTVIATSLNGASNTFIDYQNYNHGYCSTCNCAPCKCGQQNDPPPEEQPPCQACGAEQDPNACTPPNPCDPAPVCATECGLSLWWVGIGLAVAAAAASIIVTNNNGRTPHAHP